MIKKIILALFICLLISSATILWLLGSSAGIKTLLSISVPEDILQYEDLSGNLFTDIRLHKSTLTLSDKPVHIDKLSITFKPTRLYKGLFFELMAKSIDYDNQKLNSINAIFGLKFASVEAEDIQIHYGEHHLKFHGTYDFDNSLNLKAVYQNYTLDVAGQWPNINISLLDNLDTISAKLSLKDDTVTGSIIHLYAPGWLPSPIQLEGSIHDNLKFHLHSEQSPIKLDLKADGKWPDIKLNFSYDNQHITVKGKGKIDDNHMRMNWSQHADKIAPHQLQGQITYPFQKQRLDVLIKGQMAKQAILGKASIDLATQTFQANIVGTHDHLTLQGDLQDSLKIDLSTKIKDLTLYHPNASGQISLKATARGRSPIQLNMDMKSHKIAFGDYDATDITLQAKHSMDNKDLFQVNFDVKSLSYLQHQLKNFQIDISGQPLKHLIKVSGNIDNIPVSMQSKGDYKDDVYRGTVEKFSIEAKHIWALKSPVTFSYQTGKLQMSPFCVITQSHENCITFLRENGKLTWQGQLNIPYELMQIMLSSKQKPYCSLKGTLSGELINDTIEKIHTDLQIQGCQIQQIDLENAYLKMTRQDNDIKMDGEVSLDKTNKLSVAGTLPHQSPWLWQEGLINAKLFLNLKKIQPLLEAFTIEKGILQGEAKLSLRHKQPVKIGLHLTDFAAKYLPTNTSFHKSELHINTREDMLDINGSIPFEKGVLKIVGQQPLRETLDINIRAYGSNIMVMNTSEYRILINPDLNLSLSPTQMFLQGKVGINNSTITLQNYSDVVEVTSDLNRVKKADIKPSMLKANIDVHLGENIRVEAFGLNGKLIGGIKLTKEPYKQMEIKGNIDINKGIFKLFDQLLKVKKGQFIFSGSQYTNPSLHVRAEKSFDTNSFSLDDSISGDFESLTVGANITGTASHPKVSLFSSPIALSEQDILSYLLFGSSFSDATEDETQSLYKAITLLAAQNPSQKSPLTNLQNSLGIDEIGIKSEATNQRPQTEQDLISGGAQNQDTRTSVEVGKKITNRLKLFYNYDITQSIHTLITQFKIYKKFKLQTEHNANRNAVGIWYGFEFGEANDS